MTSYPVALGLKIGEHVYGFNYLEYNTNATPPPGAFEAPAGVKFTDKTHADTTHAAH
jgi:hypothetical protein